MTNAVHHSFRAAFILGKCTFRFTIHLNLPVNRFVGEKCCQPFYLHFNLLSTIILISFSKIESPVRVNCQIYYGDLM